MATITTQSSPAAPATVRNSDRMGHNVVNSDSDAAIGHREHQYSVENNEEEDEDDNASTRAVAAVEEFNELGRVDCNVPLMMPGQLRDSGGRPVHHTHASNPASSRDSRHQRQRQPPTAIQSYNLDLNQPWQRSLFRQLEKLEAMPMNKPRSGKVLLRHSESRDYASAVETDDSTVDTNASSTVPVKSQAIHRAPHRVTKPRSDTDKSVGRTSHFYKQHILSERQSISAIQDRRDESPPLTSSSPHSSQREAQTNTTNTPSTDAAKASTICATAETARGSVPEKHPLSRTKAFHEDIGLQQPFIEVELSDDDNSGPSPNTACFCWGYNVLDFWLPPESPQYRRKRVSSNQAAVSALENILESPLEPHEAAEMESQVVRKTVPASTNFFTNSTVSTLRQESRNDLDGCVSTRSSK